MGYRKPLDYNSISHQIWISGVELRDHRNDGYTQFETKKDLYRLRELLDGVLKESPKFSGEDEFLVDLEKGKVVKILSTAK